MTRFTSTFRSAVLAVATAAAAAVGAVALAPAASAAEPAPAASAAPADGNGRDAFLGTDRGSRPVFYCTDEKNNKRHNICEEAGSGS